MKSLVSYIKEELDTSNIVLKNLQIIYKGPENLTIQVPVSYSESDIQIYIEDTLMNKMPGGSEYAKNELFGDNNIKNISDVHFEYDSMDSVSGSNSVYDIGWDESYNPDLKDEELQVINIKNIKYILVFTQFELVSVTTDNYKDKLDEIIDNTEDSDELPFKITVNTDDLIYQLA